MGRPKKPLEMQKGNLTVLQQNNKKMAEKVIITGREQLKKPPKWLTNTIAIKEFKRIVKEIKDIGIIGNLDINNIGGYCNSYASYVQATEELVGAPLTVKQDTAYGIKYVKNPLIDIQKNYADEMRKFGSLCGISIDGRLKIGTIKTTESIQKAETRFGGI